MFLCACTWAFLVELTPRASVTSTEHQALRHSSTQKNLTNVAPKLKSSAFLKPRTEIDPYFSNTPYFYTHISEFSTSPLYFKHADNAFQGPYQCSLSHCPHKFPPCNKLPIRASSDKQHCFSQIGIRSYSSTRKTAAVNHIPAGHHRAATAGRSATRPSANGSVSLPQARMLGFQLSQHQL